MEKSVMEQKILALIAEISGKTDSTLDMDLMDDIGFSSVELMELISGAERKFGVRIAARDLRRVATAEDLAALVNEKLN